MEMNVIEVDSLALQWSPVVVVMKVWTKYVLCYKSEGRWFDPS